MISMPLQDTKSRAQSWADESRVGRVEIGESTLGGGSLPNESLPSYVLALAVENADAFLRGLRNQKPPIIARTEKDRVLLDPRTVLAGQDHHLIAGLRSALRSTL
jgi:L-seryl-tRNA(Ser) seleniumtransferase